MQSSLRTLNKAVIRFYIKLHLKVYKLLELEMKQIKQSGHMQLLNISKTCLLLTCNILICLLLIADMPKSLFHIL